MIVVEGDLFGHVLAREFASQGFDVCGVMSRGEEAIEHARREQPDTLLVDLLLDGELDGIETAHRIQKMHDTKVVFLQHRLSNTHQKKLKCIDNLTVLDKQDASPENIIEAAK